MSTTNYHSSDASEDTEITAADVAVLKDADNPVAWIAEVIHELD